MTQVHLCVKTDLLKVFERSVPLSIPLRHGIKAFRQAGVSSARLEHFVSRANGSHGLLKEGMTHMPL